MVDMIVLRDPRKARIVQPQPVRRNTLSPKTLTTR
jgi:hypothetical protein